jgi:HEPN domain-containing protein
VDGPPAVACFHAQQCVEKYVKGVLTLRGIDFPKTHDIENVVARLPDAASVGLSIAEQRRLTDYATVTRYPGDYEPITAEEARAAVEMARRARASLRTLLPPEVLEGPGD